MLLFFMSGLAALMYEVLWSEQLSLIFGTTEIAIVAVLAAYMFGLTSGSVWMARRINRISNPLLWYVAFEAGIAVSALLIPWCMQLLIHLQVVLFSSEQLTDASVLSGAFFVSSAFLLLFIPTALMGATLPLLTKHVVHQDTHKGSRVGLLYSINTLGACCGTLLTGFVLLPRYGLEWTLYVTVAINLLVFVIGALLLYVASTSQHKPSIHRQAIDKPKKTNVENPWVLWVMCISGFVAFAQEVAWARLLSHILGNSLYSFAVILAIFLFGISLGALFGSWLSKRRAAQSILAILQLCLAFLFLMSFILADHLTELSLQSSFGSLQFIMESLMVGAMTLLPGAVCLGACFPIAVRLCSRSYKDSASVSAQVYAWNTVGAILGAMCCGFVLLPYLGFAVTAKLLALISLCLSLWVFYVSSKNRLLWMLPATAIAVGVVLPVSVPDKLLSHSAIMKAERLGEIHFLSTGQSSTVMLLDQITEMRLLTNGLPESSIQSSGGRLSQYDTARWLSMLPVLARPAAKKILIIGLGGGLSLQAAPMSLQSIDVIELEREVIEANRVISQWRDQDPLDDARLKLHINDARSALQNSLESFDVIVSQPSHPWTAGASHLYTQEFFTLAKSRLNPDGVFVQWIGIHFIDAALLKSLLKTLNSRFQYVEMYQPNNKSSLLFMASDKPLAIDHGTFSQSLNQTDWQVLGVNSALDVRMSKRLNAQHSRSYSNDGIIITDQLNSLKTQSPLVMKNHLSRAKLNSDLASASTASLSLMVDEWYAATRYLLNRAAYDRAVRLSESILDSDTQKVIGLMIRQARNPGKKQLQLLFGYAQKPEFQQAITFFLMGARWQKLVNLSSGPLYDLIQTDPVAHDIFEIAKLMHRGDTFVGQAELNALNSVAATHPGFTLAQSMLIDLLSHKSDKNSQLEALRLLDSQMAARTTIVDLKKRFNVALQAQLLDHALNALVELRRKHAAKRASQAELKNMLDRLDLAAEGLPIADAALKERLIQLKKTINPVNSVEK
ncbi:fused MFS/spermidine synthase [Marinicella sp. W31]|uniref:fused MFS/spermidine synthase n=1 Tax=Marinicella sp. W31 TaxID=3023713 RepID=UPI0037581264